MPGPDFFIPTVERSSRQLRIHEAEGSSAGANKERELVPAFTLSARLARPSRGNPPEFGTNEIEGP